MELITRRNLLLGALTLPLANCTLTRDEDLRLGQKLSNTKVDFIDWLDMSRRIHERGTREGNKVRLNNILFDNPEIFPLLERPIQIVGEHATDIDLEAQAQAYSHSLGFHGPNAELRIYAARCIPLSSGALDCQYRSAFIRPSRTGYTVINEIK
jgi:hypothetical protein